MHEKLPVGKLMRVHGSYIVRLDYVAARGRDTLQVRGKTLPASDGYRQTMGRFLACPK